MPGNWRAALALAGLVVFVHRGLPAQQDTARTAAFVGDLGFVSVSGNTSVTSLNVGDKFTTWTRGKRFLFTQTARAVYGRTDGVKSTESYLAQLRGDYGLGATLYFFALTGWERNTFGGIDRRFEETLGLGLKALNGPHNTLEFEAGLSLFQQTNTFAPAGTSLADNYNAARLAAAYKHTFTKASSFSQSLEFLPNFDVSQQWRLNAESAFLAPISSVISFKAGYVVRYNNLPPYVSAASTARLEKSDRFLTMGVTISW